MVQSRVANAVVLAVALSISASGQLNQNCTVSVLNRNVQANPDGSWVLPNVPANVGQVKARATCVQNGITTSGESAFFTIPVNGAVNLPDIALGAGTLIPDSLTLTPANPTLNGVGQTVQLTATAHYPDNSIKNVTAGTTGTNYTSSNPAIATVSADGRVTAVAGGTVVIQAINDGTPGMVTAKVVVSGDSDGDGIPNDVEISLGLNPNNPVDAQEDPDRDGLTNLQEVNLGTNIRNPDTDGDGLKDGDEVTRGTSPLIADTDGDLIPDGVEVQTGSNPLDRSNYDLMKAVASSVLTPASFLLSTSVVFPNSSQLMNWRVNLVDGKTTLDLTADPRTNYASSNLAVCNFGAEKGRVFAGNTGGCIITISNNTLSMTATGAVQSFTPGPLSFISIPGTAMNVEVSGNYAYVAAGAAGLIVVDVGDRRNPRIVATYDTPGFANDVVVAGNYAYVADGSAGLRIVDVTNPLAPAPASSITAAGVAQDVVVRGSTAIVGYSGGFAGIQIIDVSTPTQPISLATKALSAGVLGVDYDPARKIAVGAAGTAGLLVLDLTSLTNPQQIGALAGGNVRDVVLSGNYAFLADFSRSFTSVDLTNPAAPVLRASTPQPTGGLLNDVAVFGTLAFGADESFVNDVPIIDITNPAAPVPRLLLPFRAYRDDNATGIAVDGGWVYLTAIQSDSRLYIGQYTQPDDRAGIPPQVTMISPLNGQTIVQGSTVRLSATATDDIAVASISFFVNGQPSGTNASSSFQTDHVFNTLGTATVAVRAMDFGGNSAGKSVAVSVIPDPMTTVTGRVIDASGSPVGGATVRVFSTLTFTTGFDGRFLFANVPTISGDVSVQAIKGALSGRSALRAPVPGGVTDVGDVTVFDPPVRLFPVETVFTGGNRASGIATGDLNRDGYLDMVVAQYSPFVDSVSIVLGRGSGAFQPARTYTIGGGGGYSISVVLADLNRDGNLDIVTANVEGAGVSVALGNGDGTFRLGRGFAAGGSPADVAVDDLSGDGWPDLVVANDASGDASVLLGLGDGTFQSQSRLPVGNRPRSVRIADLNNDGFKDIVAANSNSASVSVLLGTGNGAFQTQRIFATSPGPWDVAVADVNLDGKPDLITANVSSNTVSVLLGDGTGAFQGLTGLPTGIGPSAVTLSDVNGDGRPDVVTANSTSNDSSVLLGNGDGTFQPHREFGAANTPQCLAIEDVDGDGRLDILMGGATSRNVSITLGNGDGTFPAAKKFNVDSGATGIAIVDLNRDGSRDIVTSHYASTVSVLIGMGGGTFSARQSYPAGNQAYDVAVADVNRDSRDDVVVASYWNHQLVVLLGNADGTLQAQRAYPTSGSPTSLALADFNQDGIVDAALGVGNSSGNLSVLLGNGDGSFQGALKPTVGAQCNSLATGDLNSDNRADIVCVNNDGTIGILLGNGDGTFQLPRHVGAGMRPSMAALGDVNGDGRKDVVLGGYGSGLVAVHLGNGDGTFLSPVLIPAGAGTGVVSLADLDADGRLDIALASSDSNDVWVLLGNGNGTFQTPLRFFAGAGPVSLAIADLNGDGYLDLGIANSGTNDVVVLLNQKR